MTAPEGPDVAYLNRDDAWLDFRRSDVDLVDGRLRLAALPAATGPLPARSGARPPRPAGLAAAPDGTIFFTDGTHRVVRIDGCDGAREPLACLGGEGDEPTRLRDPAGLLVHPGRAALLVADTGNHRVQVFDLDTSQLLDVWGGPGTEPGRFDDPVDLDADPAGQVYVVDRGNRRVQRFTPGGEVVAAFADTVAAGVTLVDPVAVAVVADPDGPAICVLDRGRTALVVLDPAGHLISDHPLGVTGVPSGLVVTRDAVYAGESGGGGAVVRLRRDGTRVGVAAGWSGPVAALALDGRGGLVLHPGKSGPPVTLALDVASVRRGIAWGGPFGGFSGRRKDWQRVVATMGVLPAETHVRFFVHTTDHPAGSPRVDESGPVPFPAGDWSPGPDDLGDFLVRRPPARFVWVGVELTGDGTASPAVEQIRLELDRPGYVEHLPAIYRDERPDAFLPRYLALAQSLFGEVEAETTGLTGLLDPAAAPEPFLDALARWLAVDVAATWDTADRRAAVASAYTESAGRGTVEGLRRAVRRGTGVDTVIEEPIAAAAWWALADASGPDAERATSVLGVTTMLAAEPQGAVLGSTATVNRSHLIENAEYGMPLFASVAHRFTVRLFRGATYSAERVAAVEALLERERPAHTEYVICRVDPGLAVGTARVGIESVLGGDPPPGRLDGEARLGGLVLGGTPPGRIGQPGGIGVTTLLGSASVRGQ